MTEVSSIMAKICNINFWIENDPPPPFGTFPKIHQFWRCGASLNDDLTGADAVRLTISWILPFF